MIMMYGVLGFITGRYGRFWSEGFVAVYVPMAYSVAGNVYIIPKKRDKSLLLT